MPPASHSTAMPAAWILQSTLQVEPPGLAMTWNGHDAGGGQQGFHLGERSFDGSARRQRRSPGAIAFPTSRRDLSLEHARDRLGHAVQRTKDVRQQLEFEAGQCWWHDSLD